MFDKYFFIIAFSISLLIACVPETEKDKPATEKEKIYSQTLIDSDIIWALSNGFIDIYNQNMVGTSGCFQELSIGCYGPRIVNCPLGGQVTITGTVSASNGTTTVNLGYELADCKISSINSEGTNSVFLTLLGSGTLSGSWSSNYSSRNSQATSLYIFGNLSRDGYKDEQISQTCDFSVTSDTQSISGIICGRQVSW